MPNPVLEEGTIVGRRQKTVIGLSSLVGECLERNSDSENDSMGLKSYSSEYNAQKPPYKKKATINLPTKRFPDAGDDLIAFKSALSRTGLLTAAKKQDKRRSFVGDYAEKNQREHVGERKSSESSLSDNHPVLDHSHIGGGAGSKRYDSGSGNYGWFEEIQPPSSFQSMSQLDAAKSIDGARHGGIGDLDASMHNRGYGSNVTAPPYVLESSQSDQNLWKLTAGNRPPQPVVERDFFEDEWAKNFSLSNVEYSMSRDELLKRSATEELEVERFNFDPSPRSSKLRGGGLRGDFVGATRDHNILDAELSFMEQHQHQQRNEVNRVTKGSNKSSEGASTNGSNMGFPSASFKVLLKEDNMYGTTVSKTFTHSTNGVRLTETVTISIASYRVVSVFDLSKRRRTETYAQFLVIFARGGFKNTKGKWKRHSDFKKLFERCSGGDDSWCSGVNVENVRGSDDENPYLPNALCSWKLLSQRKRWFRCLNPEYLCLKAFLLERFLHDVLFESRRTNLLVRWFNEE